MTASFLSLCRDETREICGSVPLPFSARSWTTTTALPRNISRCVPRSGPCRAVCCEGAAAPDRQHARAGAPRATLNGLDAKTGAARWQDIVPMLDVVVNHRCASLQARAESGRAGGEAAAKRLAVESRGLRRALAEVRGAEPFGLAPNWRGFVKARSRTGRAGPCAATRRRCPGAAVPTPPASRPRAPKRNPRHGPPGVAVSAAAERAVPVSLWEVRAERGPLQSSHPLRRERVHPLLDGRGRGHQRAAS